MQVKRMHTRAWPNGLSRIVLLFNSDRVIDLARLSCVRGRTCGGNARESIPPGCGSETRRESIV